MGHDKIVKRFDVPVVAEIEVVYHGIEASSAEEAEDLARRRYESGDRPPGSSLVGSVVEAGPAIEDIGAG